jgi:chromosomal replication initiator protein
MDEGAWPLPRAQEKSSGTVQMTMEQWGALKQQIRDSVGHNNFRNWIEPLEFSDVVDGVATFDVPTSFLGNYVSQHYGDLILYQISRVVPDVRRLRFQVAANLSERPRQASPEPVRAVAALEATFNSAPLDDRFRFDSFVVGKPNQLAHAAARRVAEGGEPMFNPLFLYGGVGLGKTHLMHAIAWELTEKHPHLNILYLSAEQFMYRFIQALRDRKIMDFKQVFRSVDVLMVDDVQFIAGKDSTQEEFFHTFNALVEQNKQVVLSAECAPGDIAKLEDRIKSRLQCGLVVDLHPTDYELRLGILQTRAERYREQNPDLVIEPGVLELLAHRINTNVRVLEGALTRLFAFASLVGKPITQDLTQDCLADMLRSFERKVSIEEIKRKVADHYNIRLSDMVGPKRTRCYARPRQVAMYLCKQLTTRSLPEIGRSFGGRDHTTIMHGVRRIDALRQQDAEIADDLELLRRALEG